MFVQLEVSTIHYFCLWQKVVDDYDWVEHAYIDGTLLSQQFFAPIQEKLYENSNNSVVYAKEQAKNIKKAFAEKFDELDMVLKQKLINLTAEELEKKLNSIVSL